MASHTPSPLTPFFSILSTALRSVLRSPWPIGLDVFLDLHGRLLPIGHPPHPSSAGKVRG